MGYLFHCPECKYDLCKNCDIDRNGNRTKIKREEIPLELTKNMKTKRGECNKIYNGYTIFVIFF